MNPNELFQGETLILSKAANAVIALNDYGLQRLPYDGLMPLVGFKGKEAIGGKLHLTNYRVVFKSHAANRLRGTFSIFLPTITGTQDTSKLLAKKLQVSTQVQTFEFVVWGIPALRQSLHAAASSLTPEHRAWLQCIVLAEPHKVGTGFQFSEMMDRIARNLPDMVDKVLGLAQDPLSLAGVLNVLELLQLMTQIEEP